MNPQLHHLLTLRCVMALCLFAFTWIADGTASAQHIVIDPGHGGKDPGSISYGVAEKTLTLDLAKRLEKILRTKGYKTTLTRNSDRFIPLENRAAVANRIPGSIFVSLHFNGHRDRSISGFETFYYPGSTKGRLLASKVQQELKGRLSSRDRGIKPGRLKVLEHTKGTAILVESGFLTNRWENQRCSAAWFRQILAEEIAQGIRAYLR